MNNGDSFHNGLQNLELQQRNLAGTTPPAGDPPTPEKTDTPKTDPVDAPAAEPTGTIRVTASVVDNGTPHYGDASPYSPYQPSDEDTDEKRRLEKFNLASLILGISSFAANLCCLSCLTPFAAILAIIFGCVGRDEGRFQTRGLVGMILGIVYLSLLVLCIAYVAVVAVLMGDAFTEMVNEAMNNATLP